MKKTIPLVEAPSLTKAQVNYRQATSQHDCGNCVFFDSDDHTCSLVEGDISATWTCDRWESEEHEASEPTTESSREGIPDDIEVYWESDSFQERNIDTATRKSLAAKGQALSNLSYPIETAGDLSNAITLAKSGHGDVPAAKELIKKMAKKLGAEEMLQKDWPDIDATESASEFGVEDLVPLKESVVRKDGTALLKIIKPGWGTSGYYPQKTLESDGPKVFKKGLQMFWDHPTPTEEAEKPERSLNDLAAVLEDSARYLENGPSGPGLYANAKVYQPYREAVNEMGPDIGVSIRAMGKARRGSAEGRSGRIIESLERAQSIDFVTVAGAGGEILSLFESARGRNTSQIPKEESDVELQEQLREAEKQRDESQTQLQEASKQRDEALQEAARAREALMLREAQDIVAEELASSELPEVTRDRVREAASANPPMKEDKSGIDVDKLKTRVKESVAAEIDYLAKVTGSGQVRLAGTPQGDSITTREAEENEKRLEKAFTTLGLSEAERKHAIQGRE